MCCVVVKLQVLSGKLPKLANFTDAIDLGIDGAFQSIVFPKRNIELSIFKWQNYSESQRAIQ